MNTSSDNHLEFLRQEFESNDSRYLHLLQALPIAIGVGDLKTHTNLYFNPAALNLFGVKSPDDLLGHSIVEFIPPSTQKIAQKRWELLEKGIAPENAEVYLLRANGEQFLGEVTSIPITFDNKPCVMTVFADIDHREQFRKEQLKNERLGIQLSEANKLMKMKDDVITMISHQFRTPLSVIQLSVDLLTRYFDKIKPEKRSEHLNKINSESRHLTAMLENILLYSTSNNALYVFQPTVCSLKDICNEVIGEYTYVDSHKIELIIEGDVSQARIDYNLFYTALKNILKNAVDYSSPESTITIHLEARDGVYLIHVSDQGIGIALEEVKHIFDPLYRTKTVENTKGTGFGLSIAYNYIRAHHGTISCESEPDVGTTVTIAIPVEI